MSPQEFEALVVKASNGTISPEEELQLVQELGKSAEYLRTLIKTVKNTQ